MYGNRITVITNISVGTAPNGLLLFSKNPGSRPCDTAFKITPCLNCTNLSHSFKCNTSHSKKYFHPLQVALPQPGSIHKERAQSLLQNCALFLKII